MTTKLHIFAVSDSVGETAEKIAVASLLQFKVDRSITRFSRITNEEHVLKILDQAEKEDAIIIYTIVKPGLANFLGEKARERNVMAVDVMKPLFEVIQSKTGLRPAYVSGLTQKMDTEYFKRVEAIEFAIDHDNGQNLDTIHEADLIILGLPRTSKTPLSMHLANLGIKVANYPIAAETEIPEEILKLKGRVPMVGLTIDMDTLISLRQERLRSFDGSAADIDTIDALITDELDNAYCIYAKLKCLVIDVTLNNIEEIGNTITHKFKLPLRVSHQRF
ncbi:MAG: pyruvate, water dikinase regulatory protein [Syntrophomonadaceae bacterium]|jgi:regulator of PEP synthase PpsR (kinase-PPPase family)